MRSSPTLAIIDPSIEYAEEHGARVIAGDWPYDSVVMCPALSSGRPWQTLQPEDCAAVVVMGSRASVYDDYEWLTHLATWLMPILEGEVCIPLLGICFGHQFIASSAGGTIGFVHEDRRKELGIRTSMFQTGRLIPGPKALKVVASHREQVVELPPMYRCVSYRDEVRYDAIEHEVLPIFGVQFHPEAREDFLYRRGIRADGNELKYIDDSDLVLRAFRGFALSHVGAAVDKASGGIVSFW